MAFRKHCVLAAVTVILAAVVAGCAEDAAAPENITTAPPTAPAHLRAYSNGNGVIVAWGASSQPTVVGYNVYRVDGNGGSVARLNTATITVTTFTDGTAQHSHPYEYRVTSVGAGSTESAYAAVSIASRNQDRDRNERVPNERP